MKKITSNMVRCLMLVALMLPFVAQRANATKLTISGDDHYYITDFCIMPGETRNLEICLISNDHEYASLQFDIAFPDGLTPATNDYGELDLVQTSRTAAFQVVQSGWVAATDEGELKNVGIDSCWRVFVYYMTRKATVTGTDGAVLTINVTASEDFSGPQKIIIAQVENSYLDGNTGRAYYGLDDTCYVNTGTPLETIVNEGVVDSIYYVHDDLAVVEHADVPKYVFATDGKDNWIKIASVDSIYNTLKSMRVVRNCMTGVFSNENGNPMLTLTAMPDSSETDVEYTLKKYDLAKEFKPKANEVITLSGYYKESEGRMRAFSNLLGQSGELNMDWYTGENTLANGNRYDLAPSIVQLQSAWTDTTTTTSNAPRHIASTDPLAFQNYLIYPLEIPDSPSTGVTEVTMNNGVKVVACNGVITVTGASDVRVFTVTGAQVSNQAVTAVATGVYIVVADGVATKVLVE